MNNIIVLFPYFKNGTWMFDDESVGLKGEPFVCGIPEMINYVITKKNIKNTDKGVALFVSATELPSYDLKLMWSRFEAGGNWYNCLETKTDGWLCPALYKYFNSTPSSLFAIIKEIS